MVDKLVEWSGGSPLTDVRQITKQEWRDQQGIEAPTMVWERVRVPVGVKPYFVREHAHQRFKAPVVLVQNWSDDLDNWFDGDPDFTVHDVEARPKDSEGRDTEHVPGTATSTGRRGR